MSKEKQAQILYENFVISMPIIFDLISLYGFANKDTIQKFVDTLVKIEPKYLNDLKAGMKILEKSFETMSEEVRKSLKNY
jgi:activating signal cointegrator complex subunit 2